MAQSISRREMLKGLGLGAAGLVLAACTPKVVKETVQVEKVVEKEVTRVVTAVAASQEPIEIVHMLPGPLDPVAWAAEAFNLAQNEVKVDISFMPWSDYWDKLSTVFAAGTPPDVAGTHTSTVRQHAFMGVLRDLNPYIQSTPDFPTDWIQVATDLWRHKGGLYGIAWDVALLGMYYNKTLFDKAGIGRYPGGDWTWDDAKEWCTAIATDRNGKHPGEEGFEPRSLAVWGMNNVTGGWAITMRVLIMSFGGNLFDEDNTECLITDPEALECITWFHDAIHKWYIHTPPQVQAELPRGIYMTGISGMTYQMLWPAAAFAKEPPDFEWDAAIAPKKVKHATNVGGSAHSIPTEAQHGDAGWKWVQYLASDAGHRFFAQSSRIPPRKSTSLLALEIIGPPPGFKGTFVDAADEIGVVVWQHVRRPEVEKALADEFEMVWLGERDVEEAAVAAKTKVDAILAEGEG